MYAWDEITAQEVMADLRQEFPLSRSQRDGFRLKSAKTRIAGGRLPG